jgi:hypothetical protein
MRTNCSLVPEATTANIRKAEQWVADRLKAFLPAPDAPSLRLERLQELEAQTDLALAAIMFNCKDFRAGKQDRQFTDDQVLAAEEQIAYFQKTLGDELAPLASRGQVSDLPAIRKVLVRVAAQGRQDALFGEDELADQARKTMVTALVNFSTTFQESCYGQDFDPDIALAIARQNQLEGTSIDVSPCANRKFAAQPSPMYLLESCSLHGFGDWRFTWALGNPPPFGSDWQTDGGVTYRSSGDMHITRKERRDEKTRELLERHYRLSGTVDLRLTRGQEKVSQLMQLMPVKKVGGKAKYDVEVAYSDKPCKSVDEKPPGAP